MRNPHGLAALQLKLAIEREAHARTKAELLCALGALRWALDEGAFPIFRKDGTPVEYRKTMALELLSSVDQKAADEAWRKRVEAK